MLKPPGPLIDEVEERFTPQLDAIDYGAQRRVGTAQQLVGPGNDLDGELLVGAGVLDRPRGNVEESGDGAELSDGQRLGRCEMVEAGKLVWTVAGEPVEAKGVDALPIEADSRACPAGTALRQRP